MRHPFEMEQNKERKSMDFDVYFPPKERISSKDLIEATNFDFNSFEDLFYLVFYFFYLKIPS